MGKGYLTELRDPLARLHLTNRVIARFIVSTVGATLFSYVKVGDLASHLIYNSY